MSFFTRTNTTSSPRPGLLRRMLNGLFPPRAVATTVAAPAGVDRHAALEGFRRTVKELLTAYQSDYDRYARGTTFQSGFSLRFRNLFIEDLTAEARRLCQLFEGDESLPQQLQPIMEEGLQAFGKIK